MKKVALRAVGLLATVALVVAMAFAAVDYYLKIEGIPGESTDAKHKDWIEVLSYNHGLSQPASALARDGSLVAARVNHQDFTITKRMDKASPLLAKALASGKHFPSITLSLRRAGGDPQPYMRYVLHDCIITSIKPVAGDVPMEQVSFNYAKIKWTYVRGPKGLTPRTPMER